MVGLCLETRARSNRWSGHWPGPGLYRDQRITNRNNTNQSYNTHSYKVGINLHFFPLSCVPPPSQNEIEELPRDPGLWPVVSVSQGYDQGAAPDIVTQTRDNVTAVKPLTSRPHPDKQIKQFIQ